MFTRGTGPDRERRVARYSPLGAKSRELSLEPAERPGAARTCWPTRSRPGPRPRWGTAADLRPAARRRARPVDLHVHSTASDGSLPPEAVVGRARRGRTRRHRPHRPRHRWPAFPRPSRPASASASAWWAAASSPPPRPGARCTCWGISCRRDSAELEAFLERCRADRVRRGREMVTRLQRLGVGAGVRRRAAAVAAAARSAARTWPGPSCARAAPSTSATPSTATSAGAGPPSWRRSCPPFREIADLVHSVRRAGLGGAPQGAGHALVPRAAQARGARRGRDPAPESRSRAARAAHRHRAAAGAAPDRRQRLARRSRARGVPTAPSARRRCRWNGSSGWTRLRAGPPAPSRRERAACRRARRGARFLRRRRRMADVYVSARAAARVPGAAGVLSRQRHAGLKPPTVRRARRPAPLHPPSTSGRSGSIRRPRRAMPATPSGSRLPFPLLSDPGLTMAPGVRGGPARTGCTIARSVVLIEQDGTVALQPGRRARRRHRPRSL